MSAHKDSSARLDEATVAEFVKELVFIDFGPVVLKIIGSTPTTDLAVFI